VLFEGEGRGREERWSVGLEFWLGFECVEWTVVCKQCVRYSCTLIPMLVHSVRGVFVILLINMTCFE
jgi:hypothetical protein